jgi:hypothetical protein
MGMLGREISKWKQNEYQQRVLGGVWNDAPALKSEAKPGNCTHSMPHPLRLASGACTRLVGLNADRLCLLFQPPEVADWRTYILSDTNTLRR